MIAPALSGVWRRQCGARLYRRRAGQGGLAQHFARGGEWQVDAIGRVQHGRRCAFNDQRRNEQRERRPRRHVDDGCQRRWQCRGRSAGWRRFARGVAFRVRGWMAGGTAEQNASVDNCVVIGNSTAALRSHQVVLGNVDTQEFVLGGVQFNKQELLACFRSSDAAAAAAREPEASVRRGPRETLAGRSGNSATSSPPSQTRVQRDAGLAPADAAARLCRHERFAQARLW